MAVALSRYVPIEQTADRPAAWPMLFLCVWSCFLFFYGLDAGDLYRNEGLRGRIAQEMLATGDWTVPRLYGQPIFSKPPLMYWLICLVSWPAGEVTTISARLPSALAGLATVALFYWHFRCCLGPRGGYLAALILPLCAFWLDKAPSAEIDAVQVAWVTGAILFSCAVEEEDAARDAAALASGGACPRRAAPTTCLTSLTRRSAGTSPAARWTALRWWLLCALCLAGGTLTKWTAPAFLYAAALPLLWWRGRLALLFSWRHLLAASLAAALVAAWILAAIAQTSATEFLDALLREAAPRLVPSEHPKPYSWAETLLHPAVVLGAALPWSLGLLLLWRLRKTRSRSRQTSDEAPTPEVSRLRLRERLLYQGLHCWLWPSLLFWSLHPDHTLRNRAPLFPAIAGLAVFALLAWEDRRIALPSWAGRPRGWLTAFLLAWTIVKTVHVELILPGRSAERQLREKAALLAAILPGGALIHLVRLKDECLFFYLDRAAQRVEHFADLPPGAGFCLLTEEEWHSWDHARPARLLLPLHDGQGRPIYLVEM